MVLLPAMCKPDEDRLCALDAGSRDGARHFIALNESVVCDSPLFKCTDTFDTGVYGDACQYSPGRMKRVVTVAGLELVQVSGSTLAKPWEQSNYGSCTDIWAPGAWIESAFAPGRTSTQVYSGNPQAAALVAGVAAIILSKDPGATPAEVANTLFAWSSESLLMYNRPKTTRRVLQVKI